MGGPLPPALLCFALGLVLAFEARRTIWWALILLGVTGSVTLIIPIPPAWKDMALLGCWASVIVSALYVQISLRLPVWVVASLAANAGFWSGAVIALSGQPQDLLVALSCVFIVLPAAWLLKTPARLGVKIAAGWLVAIAILAAAIPLVKTPGYKADHVE